MKTRMRSIRLRRAAGVLIVFFAAAPRARADGEPGPWQFTLFAGGWNAISNPYVLKTASSSSVVSYGNSHCFGANFGRDVTPQIGIEVGWTRSFPALQLVGSPPVPIQQVTMDTFELDGLWYFSRGRLRPFATLGVGIVNTGSSFGGTNLTIAAGAGVKAFLSRLFAVRADVRFHDTSSGSTGGSAAFCDSNGCYYPRGWYWSVNVTAGLTVAF